MNEDLISIVVPIYKVEKYINTCVESILNQTYTNTEIILVDDGSPDNCGKICDEYKEKDNRIKVIHKENGGLSDARNFGLKDATGKYVVFIDSDDYIEEKYVELLYKAAKENDVPIAQCGINKVDDNGKLIEKTQIDKPTLKNYGQAIEEMCISNWDNVVVWNKIYLRSLFDKIEFPKGKIHEDEFTTYKLVYNAKKIFIIPDCLYNYRLNLNSITGKAFNIKRLDSNEAIEQRVIFFKEHKEKRLMDISNSFLLQTLINNYNMLQINKIENGKEHQKNIIKKYKEYYKIFVQDKIFLSRIKQGKGLIVFRYFPKLYCFLYNVRNK